VSSADQRASIRRLAIANRGEAAMRCIRAVKALRALEASGLECVALYTDVDRDQPFVRHADQCVRLAAAEGPVRAYLDADELLAAIRRAGADAVWPGWGFAAEDAEFADRVVSEGLRFLGPSGDVIRALGEKVGAKRLAESVGVPVVPWSRGPVPDATVAAREAERLGFPLVIKAAAGGGGRGIRAVATAAELETAFASVVSEARAAFADGAVFLERRLLGVRHVEVQIAADLHGHVVALGCRDCSVQRRHQKIVEEAPPAGLSPERLASLEQAAVRLAERAGYTGVGTVEFLVDGESFWFLEVNPRLQVEHGITEELWRVDLVELQIRIARGESLAAVIRPPRREVAIEARVCAEDPEANFLPAPGSIVRFDPTLGPRIRVDAGVAAGSRVPAEFDSLVAKVIATGDTRDEARARLVSALTDFELVVEGGATNKGYLIDLLETPAFRAGSVHTDWLDTNPALRTGSRAYVVEALVAAAILAYQRTRDAARRGFFADPSDLSAASVPASAGQRLDLSHGGGNYRLEIFAVGAWRYRVHLDGRVLTATLRGEGAHRATLETGGRSLRVLHDVSERGLRIEVEGRPYRFGTDLAGQVRAGTPALVVALHVEPGARVEAGQTLGLLEAMKMEIGLQAPVGGVVKEVCVAHGQQVGAGELLLVIDPAAGDEDPALGGERLAFPTESDPLDLFFTPQAEGATLVPDLRSAEVAPAAARRDAIVAARDEIRRVVMGYDVNAERGEKLAAFLEAPLPDGLSEAFRWELAEIRHELTLFCDVTRPFVRAPRASDSGEPGPSNHAQLRSYVRHVASAGTGLSEEFLGILRAALRHYDVWTLQHSEALERALLRLLASQLAPVLRQKLALGIIRRVHALAASGIHLGDDERLAEALALTAGMRGLVLDALADLAVEAGYSIFEGPGLASEAERTTKEVEAWLAAAEVAPTPPPADVLLHLAASPRSVFDRVGRWLVDTDPRRRAVAVAAHVSRFYAPAPPAAHTSSVVGSVHVERLDLRDGRTVLGSVVYAEETSSVVDRLARAARAAASFRGREAVEAIELLVPGEDGSGERALRDALPAELARRLPAERITVTLRTPGGSLAHLCWLRSGDRIEELEGLHGLHPETAARIDLDRLQAFELERLEAPDEITCFHLRSLEVVGDERIVVLADVRGRSPDAGYDAKLHVPAFEHAFFEATRTLRNQLGLRDPRRRLQWNRIALFVGPSLFLDDELAERLARRLAPATRHLGLEKVVVRLNVLDRAAPTRPARPIEIVIADPTGSHMELSWREVHREPLHPIRDYERKVVAARRRGLVYPYEIVRVLTGAAGGGEVGREETARALPPGHFEEFDLDPDADRPVAVSVGDRPYGLNSSSVVIGVVTTPTEKVPAGLRRVLVLSDPTVSMGSLAAPECDRIIAAIDLAERHGLPVEWVPVSSGARIALDSGTENLDATARVARRIITFTQAGGVIHVIVQGVNVGAQSYFNALATMLQHTRGALIMTPGASMVLTGRAALEASGSVSAEDEAAIGGYERVMGPNGEAQYFARDLADAYRILYEHYRYSYVPPGEPGPRRHPTSDPRDRRVTELACENGNGHAFTRVGDIFDAEANPGRKRSFAMRDVMRALVDRDGGSLERWRTWEGAEMAIVWDAHLGGHPVCLIGIESRNLPRGGYRPLDGPAAWSGGTLFPLSSKKVARALNAASGIRPVVILANLSGFDGSPESMRKLQLEYGAEIARAVVNFEGRLLFLVVSRYHGGAYVVFSRALNDGLHAAALSGSYASVIGGAPAASVVFSREVRARAAADPRVEALRRSAQGPAGGEAREVLERLWNQVLLEKQSELANEFDAVHTVGRAREVGSLEAIVEPEDMRPYLITEIERGTV
jgi:acetyl/propionyl-CoA carboxylase alpha subunit/acetyl-CoA carboxylase carboxyltransferase component